MSDITSLILQAAGGAIVSRAEIHFKKQVGIHVMVSGLALQVISLLVFMILCGDFVIAVRKTRGRLYGAQEGANFEEFLYLYVHAALYVVRHELTTLLLAI